MLAVSTPPPKVKVRYNSTKVHTENPVSLLDLLREQWVRGYGQGCGRVESLHPAWMTMLHRWGAPQLLKSSKTIYSGPSPGSHVISKELHTTLWKSGPIPGDSPLAIPALPSVSQQSTCPTLVVVWQTRTAELMKMVSVWPEDGSAIHQALNIPGCQRTKLRRQMWFCLAPKSCSRLRHEAFL